MNTKGKRLSSTNFKVLKEMVTQTNLLNSPIIPQNNFFI